MMVAYMHKYQVLRPGTTNKPRSRTGARWITALFSLYLIFVAATAAQAEQVALNYGPYQIEPLKTRIYSAVLRHSWLFTDPSSRETHLLLGYFTQGPLQLVDANLSKGTVSTVNAVGGPPLPPTAVLHPNGKFYLATFDPGFLMEYDLKTGQVRQIHQLADKGARWTIVGDDGAIYIGETLKGYVERYDPASGAWENLGIMDDPGPPYYRYAYSLGADDRYVYVGVGQNPWYLVVYDRQTRTQKTFWKELRPPEVSVVRGTTGGWFAHVPGQGWFELKNGAPVPVNKVVSYVPLEMRGNVCSDRSFVKCNLPVEIDLTRAEPATADNSEAVAEIAYRTKGAQQWKKLTVPVRTTAQTVKQLVAGPGEELLGFTGLYGPLFTLSAEKERISLLGATLRSNYDALFLPENGKWYIAGYPGAFLEFDPRKNWTLLPGGEPSNSHLNPHQPVAGFGKYHYYLAKGSDGLVYVGAHHERSATGGELGWFDPVTRKKGSLRAPFEQYDVRDLKPALGGKKLIYSSVAIKGPDGTQPKEARLFVFDVETKQVEREIVPLSGMSELDKIVETSPGIVIGVAGTEVYSVDIRDGRLLYRQPLSGHFGTTKSNDRRLVLGPDGYVWFVLVPDGLKAIPQIARIKPQDGTVEMLQGLPDLINFVLVRNESGTGYDALLYGSYEIRKVKNILNIAHVLSK